MVKKTQDKIKINQQKTKSYFLENLIPQGKLKNLENKILNQMNLKGETKFVLPQ